MRHPYGIDPDHCRCCTIGARVARAVDHPRPPYLTKLSPQPVAGHCDCCDAGISQLDYVRRQHDRLANDWRNEIAQHTRAEQLLTGALKLLPVDTRLPGDLEAAYHDHAEAWERLQKERDRLEQARCTYIQGIFGILWAIEGGPTNPVYAGHIAKIRTGRVEDALTDIAKVLHRTLDAAHREWQRPASRGTVSADREAEIPVEVAPAPRRHGRSRPKGEQATLDLGAA